MRKRRRRFIAGECSHIYQRTLDGVVLFYDREDYLLFYMIASVVAKKYNVRIFQICLMVDHIHLLVHTESLEALADFMRDFSSIFVKEYNSSVGRHGQLLYKSYGSAPKKGDKKTRSTIVYIGNNPVEKKICVSPEEYRWGFLRYMTSRNPFSVNLPVKQYSRALSRAIKTVNAVSKSGGYLSYIQMCHMFSTLRGFEKEILTDHIISLYFPFDADGLLSHYENYEQMIQAMRSTTGSEYDIKELRFVGSDLIYHEMCDFLQKELGISPVRKVIVFTEERKLQVASLLRTHTGASPYEIAKFLHLRWSAAK